MSRAPLGTCLPKTGVFERIEEAHRDMGLKVCGIPEGAPEEDQGVGLKIPGFRSFPPRLISVMTLLECKRLLPNNTRNTVLGESRELKGVIEAVITVPAYFTADQLDGTLLAAEHAGVKVKQLFAEPRAATAYYYFSLGSSPSQQ